MKYFDPLPNTKDVRREHFAARFQQASRNRKLSRQSLQPYASPTYRGGGRPVPRAPFCASTYVSIDATCPNTCRFKEKGCYVRAGFTGGMSRKLDAIAEKHRISGMNIVDQECELIDTAYGGGRIPQDGACGGRDLRLHVGGDVANRMSVVLLARAISRWYKRGGGHAWTYTHRWERIPRPMWGGIAVLASVETVAQANKAIEAKYVPALVVKNFWGPRAFTVEGLKKGWKVIPCPAETHGKTCVECRLCLDADGLYRRKRAIGFAMHGVQKNKVRLPIAPQLELL